MWLTLAAALTCNWLLKTVLGVLWEILINAYLGTGISNLHFILLIKQQFTQYSAIHTNYSLSNCTTLNKKDFNRYSDFLVIN